MLLAEKGEEGVEIVVSRPSTGSNIKVIKPLMFNKKGFMIFDNMQALYKDKDKEYISWRADPVSFIVYIERTSEYLEGECNGEFGEWKFRVSNSRRISY